MAATAAGPTPQQQKVLDLIEQGKSPDEIANELGIKRNGVYAHQRRLRAAGLLKDGKAKRRPRKSTSRSKSKASTRKRGSKRTQRRPSTRKTNGKPIFGQVESDVKKVIEQIDRRAKEIETRQAEISESQKALHEESEKLAAEHTGLDRQKGQLHEAIEVPF